MDQKIKRRFQVSQFLSENSNSLIVGTSIKFWWKIYNILGISKSRFFQNFVKFGGNLNEKFEKQSRETFLKIIAKF